nr:MAG: hypothetical protein [Bacteriophage sp.]
MITYEDKIALYENTDIANINKITADDMNEIKKTVNGIVESNIFKNLFNVGNAKISTNTRLNFNKTNNQILINGSSTTGTDIFLDSPNVNKDEDGIILKAGTYTATIKKESGLLANNLIIFYLRKSDGTNIYDGTIVFSQKIEAGVSDGTTYSSTFTLTEETRLHWIGYFGSDLITFNNLILKFQIEESPTPTSYMPWAGYIVESGSNNDGKWIKYSDGRLITMHKVTRTLARTSAWGNMYESTTQADLGNYPMAFKDIPFVYVTLHEVNALLEAVQFSSANNAGKVYILAPTLSESADYTFQVLAIGRWK